MSERVKTIERLGKLLDEGKLTRSEYDVLKAEILDQQAQPIPAPSGHSAQSATPLVESEEGLAMAEQPVFNGYDGPRSGDWGSYHRILADASIVPRRGGSFEDFAVTFDGYEAFDGENEIVDLDLKAQNHFMEEGDLPTGLSLAELRAVLFFRYRFFRHTGGTPSGSDRELIDALLDAIRLHAGADRPLDPTPQTKGERFARRVLEIAHGVRGDTHLNTPLRDFDPSALGRMSGQVASEYGVPISPSLEPPSRPIERPEPINVSALIQAWLLYVLGTVQAESSDLDGEAPPDSAPSSAAWEPNHISREEVVTKVLELAASVGYEDPKISTPLMGSDPSHPHREFLNLYGEIKTEFRLWSPGDAFNPETGAPYRLSDEEFKELSVIGDFIDPLGKYILKSYDAHVAWERANEERYERSANGVREAAWLHAIDLLRGEREPNSILRPDVVAKLSEPDALVFGEVDRLSDAAMEAMGMDLGRLQAAEVGRIILNGISSFLDGVRAGCIEALNPENDLRGLVEEQPRYVSVLVYQGMIFAVDHIAKYPNDATPMEFRGFIATYSLVAWTAVLASGVKYEPGEHNKPADIFDRLEVVPDTEDDGETQTDYEREKEQTMAFAPGPAPSEELVESTQRTPDVGSQTDMHRMALVVTLIEEYGFEPHLAAKAGLAAHPLDDNPVPSRAFEKQVRKASRQFGKTLRNLKGKPEEAEALTLDTLQTYKNLASQHGEGHYINRYDKALGAESSP